MKQDTNDQNNQQVPWNNGKLIGQKSPLKFKEIWEIRIRLQMAKNTREYQTTQRIEGQHHRLERPITYRVANRYQHSK